MLVWVKQILNDEDAFEVIIEFGRNINELKKAIKKELKDEFQIDVSVVRIYASNDTNSRIDPGATVLVPLEGHIGSSSMQPYFYSLYQHSQTGRFYFMSFHKKIF